MKNYINKSILKLQKDRDNNRLVIFVGAGVSANSGCPSWSRLIDKFADELGIASEDRKESIEYYLKIPQFYYIERGQKEYFDFIQQNMDSSNILPNDIDRQIFRLKPHTVITTNFDDLLEKTVKSGGLFYATVRQDSDLPYAQTEKMIIKMHGDEGLKNIVLKEDDYLSYSKNFPLIENYIKGLFSTKTILFVGYSAEDIDFKIIFKWVKDHLDGHFQPAYMLEIGKEKDRIDFNYYKNRGINILYYDEIENDANLLVKKRGYTNKLQGKGENLLNFLYYINEYNGDDKSDILMRIYNKVSVLEKWNYIDKDKIIERLKDIEDENIIMDERTLNFSKDESMKIGEKLHKLLYEYKSLKLQYKKVKEKCKEKQTKEEFEKLEKELDYIESKKLNLLDKELLKKIIKILYKSGITSIGLNGKDIIDFKEDLEILQENSKDEFAELLNEFEYKQLNDRLKYYLKDNNDKYGAEVQYLKKAYYLCKINNFVESYEILKDLSGYCLTTNNYLYFFIAQFNIIQLKEFIRVKKILLYDENEKLYYQNILKEINYTKGEDLYNNLVENKKEIEPIKDLNNFRYFYKKFCRFEDIVIQISNQKRNIIKGGLSVNNYLDKMRVEMEDMINYIERNYIIVYPYREIKYLYLLFIKSNFINYSIPDTTSFGISVYKLKSINRFILLIIIKYIKIKDLENLLDENDIEKINIESTGIKYLIKVLQNILEAAKNNIISRFNFENVISFYDAISNSILLLSKTDIQEEGYTEIINIFNEFIKLDFLSTDSFNKFLDFIISGFNERKYKDVQQILNVLETYIICLSDEKTTPRYNQVILFNDRFFKQLTIIVNDLDKEAKLTTNRQIKYIVERKLKEINKEKNLDDSLKNIIYYFLFTIYKIVDEDVKKEIENMARDIKSIIQNKSNKKEYIDFMYNALMSNIIVYDSNEQVEFIKDIMEYFSTLENENIKDELMRYTVDLIVNNKIKYENIANLVQLLKMEFDMFSFFVDKDKFDYTKFEIEWINYLSKNEIKKLLTNNSFARKEIKKLAMKELKNEPVKYMKKYYLDKLLLIMGISDGEPKNNKERKVKKSRQRKNYFGDVKNYRRRITKKL